MNYLSGFSEGSRIVSPVEEIVQLLNKIKHCQNHNHQGAPPTTIIESGLRKRPRNVNNLNKQMLDDNTVVEKKHN